MSSNNANQQLTDLLVSKNFEPQSLDAKGQPATNPEDATMFSFDYTGESGKDYGTVVIMADEDNNLNVYFGDNLGKGMEGDDKQAWFDFLQQIRQFSKRNMMTFSLQNLNKLKYSMQGQAALSEGLFEGWSGKKDVSWNAAATEARLVIKHQKNLGEGEARFRYIESLFIETQDGERYRMPFKSLTAGKAMLEHVRQGGKPYDLRGNHISTIVEELNLLSRFRRANQGKIFEGETQQLVEEATHYFETLKHNLKTITTRTGYKKYFESWNPAALTDEDVIIEDLRHLFVEQNIDTRVEQALPLLAKLKQEHAMKEINVFESMMTLITEGTWALPDTPQKQQQLIQLLSDELPVGADATNVTELLYDLLGDDELFDQLHSLAQQDANADARAVIIDRLEQLKSNPDVAQVIGKLKVETTPQAAPAAEEPVQEMGGTGFKREFKNGQWVKPEQVEEASDTVEKDPETGKVKSWKHEGDWEKVPKSHGKAKDPRGEVTHLSDKARRETEKLKESLDEEIDRIFELSRDTLKSYIKKAGSSGEENSAPNLASRAAHKLSDPEGDDDGEADDHKAYMRSKGIGRAVDKLEELSNDTVNNYKEKAWDEFAQGNDKRGAGIGRAISKQRGEFGHVKPTGRDEQVNELSPSTLGSYVKKASSDRAIRNFDQGFDTGKSFDQREPDYDDENAHRDDRRRKGIHKAVNRLTREEYQQLAELSPDTLKSYIKKAGASAANLGGEIGKKQAAADEVDRYTNRHMPNQSSERERMRGAVGASHDDINKVRGKTIKRVKGIGRATDRLEEGGMSEADILFQELARGTVDMYAIYAHPKTNIEKFVSDQIHDRVEEISRERGIPMDDDIDKILQIIHMDLEDEYGIDEGYDSPLDTPDAKDARERLRQAMLPVKKQHPNHPALRNFKEEEAGESVGGGNFLESTGDRTPLAGQYGHSGQLKAVEGTDADMMDRIRFLAGLTK